MCLYCRTFAAELQPGRFKMASAGALAINQGIIYSFAFVALCGALQTHFHGWGRRGKRHLQRRFLRKRGAAGQRARPLSQALSGLPALPKGEPLAKSVTLHLNQKLSRHAKDSPFGGAGALAPERARTVKFAPAASHYDPSVKIAFGALRRARQTRNYKLFYLDLWPERQRRPF